MPKTAATTTTTTTGRKRKASSKLSSPTSSKKRKEQQYLLLNQKIPSRIQCKIDVLLQDVLLPEAEEGTKTAKHYLASTTTINNNQRLAFELETRLNRTLGLVHLNVSEIEHCLNATATANFPSGRDKKKKGTAKVPEEEEEVVRNELKLFCMTAWHQQQLAYQVFEYLDQGQKGVVVVEDLHRVVSDFFTEDDALDEDDLLEMMALVQQPQQPQQDGNSNTTVVAAGEGLLSKDDLVRIARSINLQEM